MAPITLVNLGCTGDESDLFDCPLSIDQCEHSEDASLVCASDDGKYI